MRSSVGRRIVWGLAILVSITGMWISYDLTLTHLKVPREQQSILQGTCTAFATSNCEEVIKSRWGQIPPLEQVPTTQPGKPKFKATRGIPTAELGLFYWTAMLCWLVLIGPVAPSRWPVHLVFLLTTATGLAICAFLAFQMLFSDLEAWCPLCSATHVAGLLLFVFAVLLWPRATGSGTGPVVVGDVPPAAKPRAGKKTKGNDRSLFGTAPPPVAALAHAWPHWWMLTVTPIVALLAIGLEFNFFASQRARLETTVAKRSQAAFTPYYWLYAINWRHGYLAWTSTPTIGIDVSDAPLRGSADAPYSVVVFSDFECPSCRNFAHFYEKTVRPLGTKVGGLKLYFKHWPICQECNPDAKATPHPAACEAARAAEAVRILAGDDGFWKMHDLLFDPEATWKKTRDFASLAEKIGLDRDAFAKAMASEQSVRRIKRDLAEARKLPGKLQDRLGTKLPKKTRSGLRDWAKVSSTPKVFLEGRVMSPSRHSKLWAGVLAELGRRAARAQQQRTTPGITPTPAGGARTPTTRPSSGTTR